MINIVIDYNSDELTINNEAKKDKIKMKLKNPKEIASVLEEVLNQVMDKKEFVRLGTINEENRYTIAEW